TFNQQLSKKSSTMRILLLSTITAFALLLSSCEYKNLEDLNATVELNFKANYDDELLLLEKEYLYGDDNMPIKFSQFNFYIADVALIRESGTAAELIDIGFVDFPYDLNQARDAEKGQVIQLKGIPTGKYVGIRIGFGVPAALNATKPNNYPSSNPLSMASHYWDGWNSYIF